MIHGMDGMDYKDQLRSLNLITLAARRARGMMIEMWKHFHVYNKDTLAKSFKPGISERRKLDCHRFRANGIHFKMFYSSAAVAWNKLPMHVRASEKINTFKARLNVFWEHLPLKYNHLALPPWALAENGTEIRTLAR